MYTHTKKVIFLYGPTASGKTDFATSIADMLPAELVNMDVAQCYTPLHIGTAKPDWRSSVHPHHLFDIVPSPERLTVAIYRRMALEKIEEIWSRNRTPIFVGGSGFYLKSLLFPPEGAASAHISYETAFDDKDLWQQLKNVDPERAQQIHPHDLYRIKRAFHIWHETGQKPSCYKPMYRPTVPYVLVYVSRERSELYRIIDQRVIAMIEQGWPAEASALIGTPWEAFVQKGFIGYKELIESAQHMYELKHAIDRIQQKTRNYAKRQETFWRMLKKEVLLAQANHPYPQGRILEFDLTYPNIHLYIKQLLHEFSSLGCGDYETS